MVSGRGDGLATSRQHIPTQLTSYDKARKSHSLRNGVDTKTVHFDWISKELECGICEKTIRNTMVVRNCMHRFCADCILQRIHTGTRKCPTCQKVIPKKTPLKSDSNFDALINKFAVSSEKRCVKRLITESSNFCFAKRRMFDMKSPTKRLTNSDTVPGSLSSERTSFKNARISIKCNSTMDSALSTTLEIKPPLPPSTHSDTSDPPLTIDEGSSDDAYPSLQQPTTSSFARDEGISNLNDADEKKNKISRPASNHCEITTPVVVLQKSSSYDRINGMAAKSAKVNGRSERSPKCITVNPNPGPSSQNASNQNLAAMSTAGIPNGNVIHINGNVKKITNVKMSDGLSLTPSSGSGIPAEDILMLSPRSSEYMLMSGKQRLSSGIESELVLNPDASVINDDTLPIAAKRLRYIVTCPTTTVGHLCEYILQRIRVESPAEREKCLHKHVLMCPVKSDLALDDVLVVNETGEGQFTTMNVGERNSDPKSTSVFTINSPFTALGESITIEQLKAEYWANRKRPLKLIFKFVEKS